jgi:hypothetical protein
LGSDLIGIVDFDDYLFFKNRQAAYLIFRGHLTLAPPDRLRRATAAVIWQNRWFYAILSRSNRRQVSHTVSHFGSIMNKIPIVFTWVRKGPI